MIVNRTSILSRKGVSLVFSLGGAFLFSIPLLVWADSLDNPISSPSLYCLLHTVLEAFVLVAFPILVLAVVYAGFLFVAAQGNEQKLAEAKRWIVWVVVGALIVLAAQAIAFAVESTVNNIYTGAGFSGGPAVGSACP